MSIITVTNLSSGEITETKIEIKQKVKDKYPIGWFKMYTKGVKDFVLALTKQEASTVLDWHDNSEIVGPNNIFKDSFRFITKDMHKDSRSRFKRKLIDSNIIIEYGKPKKIMLNPYMFMPRQDKNIDNSQYMTQRAWLYVSEDKDIWTKDLDDFINTIFS